VFALRLQTYRERYEMMALNLRHQIAFSQKARNEATELKCHPPQAEAVEDTQTGSPKRNPALAAVRDLFIEQRREAEQLQHQHQQQRQELTGSLQHVHPYAENVFLMQQELLFEIAQSLGWGEQLGQLLEGGIVAGRPQQQQQQQQQVLPPSPPPQQQEQPPPQQQQQQQRLSALDPLRQLEQYEQRLLRITKRLARRAGRGSDRLQAVHDAMPECGGKPWSCMLRLLVRKTVMSD
jgi:hypothetical protein